MIPIAKPNIGGAEKRAVSRVLASGMLAHGPETEAFEKEFAAYIGSKHAVAVSNGTAALHLALLALGVGPGDEVIVPSFTFIATANAVLFCGGKPVFADIDPRTFNMSPEDIEAKITERTKAIIPVHLYGQPADMDPIMKIAGEHNLKVLEDACQAHGAEYHGKRVGSIGDAAAFSFYPTKNMTTGEGGMVTTNSDAVAKSVSLLRSHGQEGRYNHVSLGYNFRMTDVQAAIGREQLKKMERWNRARARNARFLTKSLKGVPGITTPFVMKDARHVFHQYTIRVNADFGMSRDDLVKKLYDAGIAAGVYYATPAHRQKMYLDKGYGSVSLPETEKAAEEVLSLPVHPVLKKEDLKKIAEELRALAKSDQSSIIA